MSVDKAQCGQTIYVMSDVCAVFFVCVGRIKGHERTLTHTPSSNGAHTSLHICTVIITFALLIHIGQCVMLDVGRRVLNMSVMCNSKYVCVTSVAFS